MTGRGPYKTRTISRLTGVSPMLLRAWERRYGLLEPERGPGGHRLYSEDDLRVLRHVMRELDGGRSIGEVAVVGREALLDRAQQVVESSANGEVPENLEAERTAVVEAAVRLDAGALNRLLDRAAGSVSPEALITGLIEPAAREIGDLWQRGACPIAGEHMASTIFVHRLRRLIESAEPQPGSPLPLALAACLPGEDHQLGLLILSYHLSRNGLRLLYLGANLPLDEVRDASRAARVSSVLLSVTRASTFRENREGLRRLAGEIGDAVAIYLGGQGAPERDRDLEAQGVRLAPPSESARDSAFRIAEEALQRHSE